LACCKLGEEIINNLIEIYQANANEDKMKARLVEFFLLQVAIHNPKGVKENHPAAYAVSWNTWKRCLNNLHNILIDEIEINMQLTVKNQSFFIVKDDIKQLFDGFVCLFVKVCRQVRQLKQSKNFCYRLVFSCLMVTSILLTRRNVQVNARGSKWASTT
jgi:hypothetical protein